MYEKFDERLWMANAISRKTLDLSVHGKIKSTPHKIKHSTKLGGNISIFLKNNEYRGIDAGCEL